ncbi:MAG: CaiB/BaiF CoA-transferase family protein [Deltaproteobacteria bacterium]|nr:CaiB/BaiF CoA-transferase family protein [Deltaproteobacteria bacterium]
MAKALAGVKVLDFTQYLSGPFCTMMLSELGAEVIKVEMPGKGEPERHASPLTPQKESFQFIDRNRGKKSVTLNLKNPKGLEIAKKLAAKADILVENFATGGMEKLGLGYDVLSKLNPGLIFASISGFGHTGPRRNDISYDVVSQAMGGLMAVTGYPDGGPLRTGISIGDYLSGFNCTIAILAALHYKTLTGEGQAIDISMQDAVWGLVFPDRADYFVTGKVPGRFGNQFASSVPFGSYDAKDGAVIICTIADAQWQKVLQAIGREDLANDERFASRDIRVKNREAVNAVVDGFCKTHTVEEIVSALKKFGVACSPLPTFDQVANDPHLEAREMFVEVEQPVSGKVKLLGSTFKMTKTPGDRKMPAPAVGEQNKDIYGGLLGIDAKELEQLKAEGVI